MKKIIAAALIAAVSLVGFAGVAHSQTAPDPCPQGYQGQWPCNGGYSPPPSTDPCPQGCTPPCPQGQWPCASDSPLQPATITKVTPSTTPEPAPVGMPTPSTAPAPPTTVSPAVATLRSLPATGSTTALPIIVGVLALLVGSALLLAGRRAAS